MNEKRPIPNWILDLAFRNIVDQFPCSREAIEIGCIVPALTEHAAIIPNATGAPAWRGSYVKY